MCPCVCGVATIDFESAVELIYATSGGIAAGATIITQPTPLKFCTSLFSHRGNFRGLRGDA